MLQEDDGLGVGDIAGGNHLHRIGESQFQHLDILALVGEVRRYLERPGCNIPARQTAMARLRWAADRAMEQP